MVDRNVLDEILGTIQPADTKLAASEKQRLLAHLPDGPASEVLATLSSKIAGIRRSKNAPTAKRLALVFAADGNSNDSSTDETLRLAAGKHWLNSFARAHDATLQVLDCGLSLRDATLPPSVLSCRVGAPGDSLGMTQEQTLVAVQSGIAIVLSFVADGLDMLLACELGEGREERSEKTREALKNGDALFALQTHGGFEVGVMTGAFLACAAVRIPVVIDGPSSQAAAAVAARLQIDASAYFIDAHNDNLNLAPGNQGAAAINALNEINTAMRLQKELRLAESTSAKA